MADHDTPVWLITGCSTGLGRELAEALIAGGYRLVATARNTEDIEDLARMGGDRVLALPLDVTDDAQAEAAVAQALARFDRIDVLVNNAGIGYFGAIEESVEAEVRRIFEINFWGLARMTEKVLPSMRVRRAGTIVNISSVGGIRASAGVGYYNATKFAVDGWSEALATEVNPLGIRVLIVAPSAFRTDWAGRSANEIVDPIEDYAATAGARRAQVRGWSGAQPGDPKRAAKAIIDAVEAETPPLRLLLGKMALQGGRAKIEALRADFDAWADVTEGADFPPT
ncbi:3-phenylpropionate-dihydrodiol/cinnamic acid-dihydrodiol dehydrogenase [Brevundimonas sp. NIBR10]|uniref:oxidoreductase n=1 Tax=Brevundimonas sp. NIBR10 TaxID=3015997 RepID=UPI0022F1AA48|nr:oxidoreductase [Brevundimonas sp. NIBR10]WGM45373.1 3-phenylpropionate-dihydrodiol/cinnamic acid-dihydrodiol dehydrogenase [Brevundimonas sp. NIBR10]